MDEKVSKALVILSGGQDSTTCLAIARRDFNEVHGITFNYQQRHSIELESAIAVSKALAINSHEIINIGSVFKSESPLVSDNFLGQYNSVTELPQEIEPTFIPGRNILFLTIAANRAYALEITDIFLGVCETDFAGYWDCRQSFIDAIKAALGEGMYGEKDIYRIHTPLMHLTKAQSVHLAQEVFGEHFTEITELTHTCYGGIKGGCGKCHACILRDRGFREAGLDDPIWKYRQV